MTTTLASSELPLTDGVLPLHCALAVDIKKSAAIVLPATVKLRSASKASDRLAFPCPTVVAWATSAPFRAPTLPIEMGETSSSEASSAPPPEGNGPVSAIVIGDSGGTLAWTTNARPLKAGADDVCPIVPAGARSAPVRSAIFREYQR